MEMERINENTIRVLIENADLEARGITFLDLLGNPKQIENFFYSILEEVDIDEQFQETDAVTFQVLPNRNGLELFISKNMMLSEDVLQGDDMDDLGQDTPFAELLKKSLADKQTEEEQTIEVTTEVYEPETLLYVFEFSSIEQLIALAKEYSLDNIQTDLYKGEEKYYLAVRFYTKALSEKAIRFGIARILEFGQTSTISLEYLGEYGQKLMEKSALEQIKFYF